MKKVADIVFDCLTYAIINLNIGRKGIRKRLIFFAHFYEKIEFYNYFILKR